MPSIEYKLVHHRGEDRILVSFEKNADWNRRIRAVNGVRWSRTLKGWTIPDTAINRHKCGFTGEQQLVPVQPAVVTEPPAPVFTPLSENNRTQLRLFIQQLQLKAYSPSTIRTYRNEMMQLLQLLGKVPVQHLQPVDLQRYL